MSTPQCPLIKEAFSSFTFQNETLRFDFLGTENKVTISIKPLCRFVIESEGEDPYRCARPLEASEEIYCWHHALLLGIEQNPARGLEEEKEIRRMKLSESDFVRQVVPNHKYLEILKRHILDTGTEFDLNEAGEVRIFVDLEDGRRFHESILNEVRGDKREDTREGGIGVVSSGPSCGEKEVGGAGTGGERGSEEKM